MTPENTPPPEKDKRARHRSPNYPGIGLRAAVGKITAVYNQDGLAASPKPAALKHMGFEKPHGEAGRVLSALKSFGLVEEANERVKLTQRGINIVARPEDDAQHVEALREAIIGPDIYRELLREYQTSGLPSDASLKSELIADRRFNPNAVDGFLSDFRDSLDFSGISDLSVLELEQEIEDTPDAKEEEAPTTVGKMFVKELERGRSPGEALVKVGEKMRNSPILTQTLVISIPRDFKVDIGVRGDELKKEDLAKIKSQFNRWIEGLEEAFD
jgi:hypothetical protein